MTADILGQVVLEIESPQSNGMAEAFVRTIKRDYVHVSPCPDAQRSCTSFNPPLHPQAVVARTTGHDHELRVRTRHSDIIHPVNSSQLEPLVVRELNRQAHVRSLPASPVRAVQALVQEAARSLDDGDAGMERGRCDDWFFFCQAAWPMVGGISSIIAGEPRCSAQAGLRDIIWLTCDPAFPGEMGLMTGRPRSATIRAEVASTLYELPLDAYRSWCGGRGCVRAPRGRRRCRQIFRHNP